MTPIQRGHAQRLGLRKPQPPLLIEINVDTTELHQATENFRAAMGQFESHAREAFLNIGRALRGDFRGL